MFAIVTVFLFGIVGNLVLLGAHYWLPVALKRETKPPESYIWGATLGILLPFVAWLGFWWAFAGPTIPVVTVLWAFPALCILAGLGTVLGYALDGRHGRHLDTALDAARRQRLTELLAAADADPAAALAGIRELMRHAGSQDTRPR